LVDRERDYPEPLFSFIDFLSVQFGDPMRRIHECAAARCTQHGVLDILFHERIELGGNSLTRIRLRECGTVTQILSSSSQFEE